MAAFPAIARRARAAPVAPVQAHAPSQWSQWDVGQEELRAPDLPQPARLEDPTLDAMLSEWAKLQRETCEAQIRIFQSLLEAHRKKLDATLNAQVHESKRNLPKTPLVPMACCDASLDEQAKHNLDQIHVSAEGAVTPRVQEDDDEGEIGNLPPPIGANAKDAPKADSYATPLIEQDRSQVAVVEDCAGKDGVLPNLEEDAKDDEILGWWRHTSGLHTVEKWVTNYRKHPAGWGALLMIHGIPEVTGRLRSKVENYAIYSALFLSVSMSMLTDPPSYMTKSCDAGTTASEWECEIQKRAYSYLLVVGIAAHMLSILLAMSFVNVLNEAARDSDVIRMFARGKGFVATVKCQNAFVVGCVTDLLAVVVATKTNTGWDMVALAVAVGVAAYVVLRRTARLLFSSASIVKYWREELGGKPDSDDPYVLDVPLTILHRRAKAAREAGVAVQRHLGKS